MYSKELAGQVLSKIERAIETIQERTEQVRDLNDFLTSPQGMEKLDAVCMQLISIGESVKNLDKITERSLLPTYPEIPWKDVMGMRDIIAHHYFDLDAEEIWHILQFDLMPLLDAIRFLKNKLETD